MTLGDIFEYERPDRYIVSSEKYQDDYPVPVLTANQAFVLGYTDETEGIYDKGPVILFDDFTCDMKFADFPFKVKSSAMKLLTPKNGIPIFYAYSLLQHINYKPEGHARHWISIMQPITVTIPDSAEQNKISDVLMLVNKRIAKQQVLIEHLKKYKRGVIKKIFAQELRFSAKDGKPFPEWKEYILENVVKFLDGRRKPLESAERSTMKGEYPYYGASGIIDYIDKYIFDEPLILLGEDGANIITRSSPLCFIATGKYWVNNHAHVMRPKAGFDLKFVCEALESIDYTKYNTGTAQPKLNQEKCRKITFCYPCYEEQIIIAEYITNLNQRIIKAEKQLLLLEAQKKALLQQLFI